MLGAWRPKHVEWLCRNKTCTVLHQVGISFDLYYDARKHKIKTKSGICACVITFQAQSTISFIQSFFLESLKRMLSKEIGLGFVKVNQRWTDKKDTDAQHVSKVKVTYAFGYHHSWYLAFSILPNTDIATLSLSWELLWFKVMWCFTSR